MIPPDTFTPAGTVFTARVMRGKPPFTRHKRYTGRRAAGIRYERKAQDHLQFLFPDTYVPSPWLYFKSDSYTRPRWCQPDGLNVDIPRGIITCVEIKYQHTADAWWQVKKLYLPVLEKIFKPDLWKLEFCEVVKWYDPAVLFPEPIQLTMTVDQPSDKFKVHIWRP